MKRFDSAKAFRERLEKRKATRAAAAEAAEARAREAEERASIRKQLELERELARFKHRTTISDCGELGDVDMLTNIENAKKRLAEIDAEPPRRPSRAMLAGLALALCAFDVAGPYPTKDDPHG